MLVPDDLGRPRPPVASRTVSRAPANRDCTTAHIHPPTGAQGMNTGIQDAPTWPGSWRSRSTTTPHLLDRDDAERRPFGEEVVGRAVRSAGEGIGADSTSADYVLRREAQLLIDYTGSPVVVGGAGRRAPDATGLTRAAVTGPLRLYSLLGRREHTALFYAGGDAGPADVAAVATRGTGRRRGRTRTDGLLSDRGPRCRRRRHRAAADPGPRPLLRPDVFGRTFVGIHRAPRRPSGLRLRGHPRRRVGRASARNIRLSATRTSPPASSRCGNFAAGWPAPWGGAAG